ncbi:MAG: hypothetical protein IJR36_04975 [Lachnospiraceae bacterium]|nr:hypothetical protein [Lachnospiraceae bacterium]
MIRLAFFDIDGTVSAPLYRMENGSLGIGWPKEGWMSFCREHPQDAYAECRPVLPVKRYAEALRARGAKLYALSTMELPEERSSKLVFLEKHFPGMFEELLGPEEDAQKVDIIREIAAREGAKISECELVEDTYRTLLLANEAGIRCTHVSHLLTEEAWNVEDYATAVE